jgi:hypothetical protein
METEFAKVFKEEQNKYKKDKAMAEVYEEAINERIIEESKKEIKFRTRHDRMSIKHVFKPELDLTDQTDASRFSMASIHSKLVNGEPVMPSVIKQNGVYSEEGTPEGDLTELLVKNQENVQKYGENIQEQLDNIVAQTQNDDESNDDEQVEPTIVEEVVTQSDTTATTTK